MANDTKSTTAERLSPLVDLSTASQMPVLVERKGNVLELRKGEHHVYPIELDRVTTPEAALGWIHHLCEKGWVTPLHIWQFIDEARKAGVKVDFDA